jgi:hypothetical protein
MVLNVTFNHISVLAVNFIDICGGSRRKPPSELSQVTENFYHKIVKIKKSERGEGL